MHTARTTYLAPLLIALLTALAACSHDDTPDATAPTPHPGRRVELRLAVAPGDLSNDTRAMGDPGTTQFLKAPTKLYLFFVDSDGTVRQLLDDASTPTPLTQPLTPERPDHTEPNTSALATHLDEVYRYHAIGITLPEGCKSGRLYAVMSNADLKHGSTYLKDIPVSTEDDVLGLQFDVEGSDIRKDLPNIYSTPYNYRPDGTTYYGTIGDGDDVVDLMLYHVAARVDLMWNVAGGDAVQEDFRITFIEARKLNEYDCYLFRPTENLRTNKSGYDLTLMENDATGSEVGRQWYGRQTFYTIPYRDDTTSGEYKDNKFHLRLRMWKNDQDASSSGVTNATSGYQTDLQMDMTRANAVFVPWLRVNLKYTEAFEYSNKETAVSLTQQ